MTIEAALTIEWSIDNRMRQRKQNKTKTMTLDWDNVNRQGQE